MKTEKAFLVLLSILSVCVAGEFLWDREAHAIPAFARKYQTSCATCHEAYPRLNGVGEAFRLNGYKFMDDELYIKDEPVEMADEAYKNVWPKAIWPSDIPGLPPISVVLESQLQFDIGGTEDSRTDFDFPNNATILGAGTFGDTVSFLVEISFSQGGGGHHGGGGDESEDTETDIEGWIQFEDILGPENLFNIRVGTVGMQEMGLFTHRNHNRLTDNPYLYASWSMPEPHDSFFSFEETNEFLIMAQPGIEINGFGERWRYAVGVVNGNGDSGNDNNSEKDFFAQLAYKFGGLAFDGSGIGDSEGNLPSSEAWRDDSLTVSLFGYQGTALIETSTVGNSWRGDDDFWRAGAGLLWRFKDFQLGGGYVFGDNDRPYGVLTDKSVDSEAWFVEASYFIYPWLVPTFRYEGLRLDLPKNVRGIQSDQDRERIIFGAKALLRANVYLTLEGRFYTKDQRSTRAFPKGDTDDDNEVVSTLNFAF
jgi:hypothetical protein